MALPRGRRPTEQWLSPHKAAKIAGCHPNTVYSWIKRHEIPFERNPRNNYVKIRKSNLVRFMKEVYGLEIE